MILSGKDQIYNAPAREGCFLTLPGKGDVTMEDNTSKKEAIPVMEAAEELGTTHLRILMLIKENALEGKQEGVVLTGFLDCFGLMEGCPGAFPPAGSHAGGPAAVIDDWRATGHKRAEACCFIR
jgi:hypothetical protein